ncbi:prohibitin family protein [Candidatus Bathyarchaeota archaeon]|nr:prohibitin family protein [Candidatus Bathyarchaeota archaeon]
MSRRYFERSVEFRPPRVRRAAALAVLLIIVVGSIMLFSVGHIGVGYVAIIVDPLTGSMRSIGDGASARYFFKPPWASVYKVYVAMESIHMWSEAGQRGEFPAVEALTRDGLRVDVDITVRWRISPSKVVELYRNYPGMDWKDRAIIPIIRETIRDLIARYDAIDTIEKRGEIGALLGEELEKALKEDPSLEGAIILEGINLRRIALPDAFVNAIEKKLAAEQLAIAAQYNRTRMLVLANATAVSKIIEAEGAAKSRIIVANATRKAIEIIAGETGNTTSITNLYLYLETLREIAEKGGSIIIVSGEDRFLIPLQTR